MEILLNWPNANLLYEDRINGGNLRLVHQDEHQNVDYETFISTRCNSTTEIIRYLISDNPNWETVNTPTKEIYQVSFRCETDDDEDPSVHSMIVHGDDVYHSYAGWYPLRKVHMPNLRELLQNPTHNWAELTGDANRPPFSLRVQFSEPNQIDLTSIESKYKQL